MTTSNVESYVVLPPEIAKGEAVSFVDYQQLARKTDRFLEGDLELPILGLFGEIGSLLSALKKKQRDRTDAERYKQLIVEELGDVLWYLSVVASRAGLKLPVLAQQLYREHEDWEIVDETYGSFGELYHLEKVAISDAEFSKRVLRLGGRVGALLNDYMAGDLRVNRDKLSAHLVEVLRAVVGAADAAGVDLDLVAYENLRKIFSRWPLAAAYPPEIDTGRGVNERFPATLEFYVSEEEVAGKLYVIQKCNGIIIGDRLTDNREEHDDYRFHDVFHMAFAAHLGWSPVLRALLHLKRKSSPSIDENQDGARAILIEEGLATFIFARGRALGLDVGNTRTDVDYDLLKLIQEFVRGYEPERCNLWQWERAILDGFKVFRSLKAERRGFIVLDFENHKIDFRSGCE